MRILVIVESAGPKHKSIQKYLNEMRDGNSYTVSASCGHIMDLDRKKLSVDVDDNYRPEYFPYPDKSNVIANLRKIKRTCQAVWIASDLDQEGEFIGWSLCNVLGLPVKDTPRMIFNEVSKKSIQEAARNLKRLDNKMLDAQKCRRVMDRLIGWKISHAAKSINDRLSVGRVQTMMVKAVLDREREAEGFGRTLAFHTTGIFVASGGRGSKGAKRDWIEGKMNVQFSGETGLMDVREFLEDCAGAGEFKVMEKSDRIATRNPSPPLITSTLQSLVSRKAGLSPKVVLDVAQSLYQKGVISYPRTDCPKLPEDKMKACGDLIKSRWGAEYHKSRQFKSKSKSAQEAHACIYPTDIEVRELHSNAEVGFTDMDRKVYRYIWMYTVSSQMSPSRSKVYKVKIDHSIRKKKGKKEWFVAEHEKLLFEGYLKLWGKEAEKVGDSDGEEGEGEGGGGSVGKNSAILDLEKGDVVDPVKVESRQKSSQGPSPYTQSGLIDRMEALGIGRPSTRGKILEDLISAHRAKEFLYKGDVKGESVMLRTLTWGGEVTGEIKQVTEEVKVGACKNRLLTTELGRAVVDFVDRNFGEVFTYDFTGNLEADMKSIESGDVVWYQVVDRLYKAFEGKLANFKRWGRGTGAGGDGGDGLGGIERKPKRPIGVWEGKPALVYLAKYGPVIQVGEDGDPTKRYVDLPKNYKLDGVEMGEVEWLLKLPATLGKLGDGRDVILRRSKKTGLYLEAAKGRESKTYTVRGEMWGMTGDNVDREVRAMGEDEKARALLDGGGDGKFKMLEGEIKKMDRGKQVIREVEGIGIMEGKWGPYFIYEDLIVGIPKHLNLGTIDKVGLMTLYNAKVAKGGGRRRGGFGGKKKGAGGGGGGRGKIKLNLKFK